jgi:hypothetical protein
MKQINIKDIKRGDVCSFFLRTKTYYLVLKVEPDNMFFLLSDDGIVFKSNKLNPISLAFQH